jgi:hypothetical protein
LPHGVLDRVESFAGGILHSLDLVIAGAPDLPGQGLKVRAQAGEMVGDLLNIIAERVLTWHFGVFCGHSHPPV